MCWWNFCGLTERDEIERYRPLVYRFDDAAAGAQQAQMVSGRCIGRVALACMLLRLLWLGSHTV
jgi:hypothetical protein